MIKRWINTLLYNWLMRLKYGRPPIRRDYIREPRAKIMYNPFEDKPFWCVLNPSTHTWEWSKVATHYQLKRWMDETDEVRNRGIAFPEALDRMNEATNEGE